MSRTDQTEIPDLTSFDELFLNNHQFLCMVAVKIVLDDFVAKDLVQDFFVKYWESGDKINAKNFEAYAYRSVKNTCFNYLKHQAVAAKHHISVPVSQLESFPDTDQSEDIDEELPERKLRLKRVHQLLEELPAERRKVFEFHAIDGLNYRQIAERLDISTNTVKTQLRRAYSTLRGKAIATVVLGYFMKYL